MSKRILCLLLTLAMSLSLLSVTAWAEEVETVAENSMECAEAAEYGDPEEEEQVWEVPAKETVPEKPVRHEQTADLTPQTYYYSGDLFNEYEYIVSVGNKVQVKASGEYIGTWVSSNPAVATVNEKGVVTGVSTGEAKITFTGYNVDKEEHDDAEENFEEDTEKTEEAEEVEDSAFVTVTNPKLSASSVFLNLYGAYELTDGSYWVDGGSLNVTGLCYDSNIKVSSSSKDLVVEQNHWNEECSIDLRPKKSGKYTVTITADGKTMKCTVTVFKASFNRNSKSCGDINNKKWDPYYTSLALYTGETTTLTLSGVPSSVTPKWSTSNSKVATVNSSGKVTAKGIGEAVITVKLGTVKLEYPVSVSYKTAVKALRSCIKNYNSTYSQPKRMKKGYYDCSSYVWRNYKEAGLALGGSKSYAPTAADLAKWCVKNGYMIYEGTVNVADLLPGDLVFETGAKNGRYKSIYHVDMAQGNGKLITVARTKSYWETLSGVMVARPCGTKSGSLKASKKSKSETKLTWSGVYKATGYQVYRSTKKESGFKKLATTKSTTYNAKTNHKKTYYYKVRPYWTKNGKTYYGKYTSVVKYK